jgi:recombination protein RecA
VVEVTISAEHRAQALNQAILGVEKKYGRGTVMRLGERPAEKIEVVSSGCLSLDLALGVGGYAKGRLIEVFGPESSGKTTLALHAIAEVQSRGGTAAFIDAEHALDVTYARKLGVDTDALLLAQPDNGEQALEIAEALVRSGAVDILVVDSVAALVPQAEIEGSMGDQHMGLQARLMSQALRKLTGITARSGCTLFFINQVRQKIGVVFGNGEVTTGGNALKFYASVRIEIRRIGSVADGTTQIGNRTKIKVVKNKLAPPFRQVEVDVLFGKGICPISELLDLGETHGVIEKNGAWYSFGDQRLGQGKEKARQLLTDDATLRAAVRQAVFAKALPDVVAPMTMPEAK